MIPDPFAADLAAAATDRQRQAHRPATTDARESAVRLFMAFCLITNIVYTRITYQHVCCYVEYLARSYKSPASVSNAISHLRTFYLLAGLSTQALHHFRVNMALRAVAITMRHVLDPPQPVTPAVLKAILAYLPALQTPEATRLAVLLIWASSTRVQCPSSICPITSRQLTTP